MRRRRRGRRGVCSPDFSRRARCFSGGRSFRGTRSEDDGRVREPRQTPFPGDPGRGPVLPDRDRLGGRRAPRADQPLRRSERREHGDGGLDVLLRGLRRRQVQDHGEARPPAAARRRLRGARLRRAGRRSGRRLHVGGRAPRKRLQRDDRHRDPRPLLLVPRRRSYVSARRHRCRRRFGPGEVEYDIKGFYADRSSSWPFVFGGGGASRSPALSSSSAANSPARPEKRAKIDADAVETVKQIGCIRIQFCKVRATRVASVPSLRA